MSGLTYDAKILAGLATFAASFFLFYQYRRLHLTDFHTEPSTADTEATTSTAQSSPDRTVGYASYGTLGLPSAIVVFFHSIPGSRLVPVPRLRQLCDEHNLRLIAVERPGFGLTSPVPAEQSTHLVSSQDVRAVLHKVLPGTVEKVTIIGYSMGGPLAIRFVHDYADLVDRLYLIGTAGFDTLPQTHSFDVKWSPILHGHRLKDEKVNLANRLAQTLARHTPWVLEIGWTLAAAAMTHEDNYIDNVLKSTTKDDRARLSDEDERLWKTTGRETFRQGIQGCVKALLEVFGSSSPDGWGWDVAPVKDQIASYRIQTRFYAAKEDNFVPPSVVVGMADILGAKPENFTFYQDGTGHISLLKYAMLDIIRREGR